MAINTELFEKRYINRDLILLDTACFNHIFNNKRWFIKYKEIVPLEIRASNSRTGLAIRKDIVRVPFLLPNGSINIIELLNIMY